MVYIGSLSPINFFQPITPPQALSTPLSVSIHGLYIYVYKSFTFLYRSDPAQPPTEGAEGAEGTAPGGAPPGPPPNTTSNRRLQQTQAQVEEVGGAFSPEGFQIIGV